MSSLIIVTDLRSVILVAPVFRLKIHVATQHANILKPLRNANDVASLSINSLYTQTQTNKSYNNNK